jgi:ATP-dependent Clp protease ATP-binding subunit ClpC
MFERFTERARRVIFFARLEASQTGCDAISTEHIYSLKDDLVTSGHLLLGVLDEEQSGACAILKRYGIQREQVMTRLPDSSEEQGPPNPDIGFDLLP